MNEQKRGQYTLAYKQEAVRLVKAGQSVSVVSKTLGMSNKTLHSWVKLERQGKLDKSEGKVVSKEQMELARLRAENARLKMERDILKKATAYFAREST
jgi:transposase